jgi:NAD+ kinase
VHASTFGDRLVAKFGLPVRGFRNARTSGHAGPGHELSSSRNVLSREYVTGDGAATPVGEEIRAAHEDA